MEWMSVLEVIVGVTLWSLGSVIIINTVSRTRKDH